MRRKMITAEVVAEIEWLLTTKQNEAAIAAQLGISPYLIKVVANDEESREGPAPPTRPKARCLESKEQIEFATIRMIERLLSRGVFSYPEIAREVGVSKNTVCAVATGRRKAILLARPILNNGERFLPRPQRCGICGARLIVTPCRVCRVRLEKHLALQRIRD